MNMARVCHNSLTYYRMTDKLVLIGASGALGDMTLQTARRKGIAAIATYESRRFTGGVRFRAENDSLVDIGVKSGDTVILFAAKSSQDWVRRNPDEARALNVTATIRLANEAYRLGANFIFISSEAVFGQDCSHGWAEDADLCPVTEYGRQKAEAESILRELDNVCIVRTGWNVTDRMSGQCVIQNTYEKLLDGSARLAHDNRISLTYAGDTAQCLLRLACEKFVGVFHAVSGMSITRTAMADDIIEASKMKSNMHYERIRFADLALSEPKPAQAWLTSTRNSWFGIDWFLSPQDLIRRKVAQLDEVFCDR